MKIIKFSEADDNFNWNSRYDFPTFGTEMALRTEGTIFFEEPSFSERSLFTLEFFLEFKTAILMHLGNHNFKRHIALPMSGDGLDIKRRSDKFFIYHKGELLERNDWILFLKDFTELERILCGQMKKCFPAFMKTPEILTLFSSGAL